MASTRTNRLAHPRGSNPPARETPLPWGKLSVLLAVQLTEPMGNTIILPFMYEMVGGFDIVHDPKDISFYAGLLFTSFHVLRTFTAMYWGTLSDRIGRRPVILVGLLGDLLTFVMFGLSKSLTWALVVRCLNGFFTGGTVVIRPIIAEISDNTNRARMMSMFPLIWHVGAMLGGAIGGLTVDPVKNYPWLFGNSILFREFPYLLPCLVGSSVGLFGLVVGFFCLEETLVVKSSSSPINSAMSETTPLVSEAQHEEGICETNATSKPLSKWDILTPTVIRILVTNTGLCLAIIMHNQLYPIIAATDIADGGLGMDAQTIGFTLMLCSGFIFYLQLYVYPKEEQKHGALLCYRHGLLWLALFAFTLPLFSILARFKSSSPEQFIAIGYAGHSSLASCLFWGLLCIILYIRMYGDALAFTSIHLLVTNVAPRKDYLGFITGLQNQLNGVAFLFGPLISGYLWSWSNKHSFPYPFNSHFAWVLSGLSLLAAWYITLQIPDSVNVFASGSDEQSHADPDDDE